MQWVSLSHSPAAAFDMMGVGGGETHYVMAHPTLWILLNNKAEGEELTQGMWIVRFTTAQYKTLLVVTKRVPKLENMVAALFFITVQKP